MSKPQWAWVKVDDCNYTFDRGNEFEFQARSYLKGGPLSDAMGGRWKWEICLNGERICYGYETTTELAMIACENAALELVETIMGSKLSAVDND